MPDSQIQVLDAALFERLLEQARESPRLRTNHNFHLSMEDNPHRFLNVMVRGTYVTPHRHCDPPKSESFLVLAGEVGFFAFDDSGRVAKALMLGRDPVGIDIQPGVWHTLAVLSDTAICYEVKPGPYAAANDKDFAPWAPREGDPSASDYLARLLSQDWGLYRTLQINTQRIREAAKDLAVANEVVGQRLDELWQRIDAQPKSLKWKLRSRVGDRVSWYELPEEVRQPYLAD